VLAKADSKRKAEDRDVFDPEAETAAAWDQWLGFAQDVLDDVRDHAPAKRDEREDED
jgi:hypothetical protein